MFTPTILFAAAIVCTTNPAPATSNYVTQVPVTTNVVSQVNYTTNNIVCITNTPPPSGGWLKIFGGTGVDVANAVAADASGNVIAAGFFNGTVNFGGTTLTSAGGGSVGGDIYVVKYAPSGALLWVKAFGDTGDDAANGLAIDRNGDVLVTGFFSGTVNFGGATLTSTAYKDAFVLKLSGANGASQWSKKIGATDWSTNPDDYGYAIATDPNNGDVVVTGQHSSNGLYDFGGGLVAITSGINTFLIRYTSAGALVWAKSMKGFSQDSGRAVAVDNSGNVLLTGQTQGPIDLGGGSNLPYVSNPQFSNGFLAKYNAAGAHVWSLAFGSAIGLSEGLGIAVDGSGNVAITGRFMGTVGFGNGVNLTGSLGLPSAYLVKFNGANGQAMWGKSFVADLMAIGRGVAMDAAGNVCLTGLFFNNCNFGGGTLTSAGGNDGFYAKFNASGVHQSSMRFGGPGTDQSQAISMDNAGNTLLAGTTGGGTFGATNVTTQGNDAFVWKQ